jgi:hypothetical protein
VAEQFIGEAIEPIIETMDTGRMAAGGPGLPRQFRWRGDTVSVTRVLRTWRETGPCHHGSGEQYVRKHWFEVETDAGAKMAIYFERQARSRSRKRWWLFSVEEPAAPPDGPLNAS